MNKNFIKILLTALSFSLFSCEKEKNSVVDQFLIPPSVISVSLSDTSLDLDTTTANTIIRTNGVYRITDSIIVTVTDINGINDIKQVSYRVLKPNSIASFTSGALYRENGNLTSAVYSRKVSFNINRSDAGLIRIEVTALGQTNLSSNTLSTSLLITRNNSKPILSALFVPDTLIQPVNGLLPFILSVTASDSDGYSDINQVFFKQLSPSVTSNIPLFDDGDFFIHGDELSGDGTFTRILSIDSSNTPGSHKLLFQAFDNAGSVTDSLFGTFFIK